MKSMLQDVRYGLRMMAKNPGFTAVAVITLALGVGANSAVFSIVNALTLRPLAVREPDRLAAIRVIRPDGRTTYSIAYPDYEYYRDNNRSFSGLAVAGSATVNWRSGASSDHRVDAVAQAQAALRARARELQARDRREALRAGLAQPASE